MSIMSYHPQQEGPKIMINFYDNIQQINLPSTFFELFNLIPSIISVEDSYFINNFTLTYTFQYGKYEITNENTYARLYNLAQAGKVDQIKIELKLNNNMINIPFQQQQFPHIKQIEFDVGCKSCSAYPVYGTVYRCARCKFYVCGKCEEVFGDQHEHALIQIRNEEHMKDSNNLAYTNSLMFTQKLNSQVQMSEVKQDEDKTNPKVIMNSVKNIPNKLKEIPDKIKGFLSNVYSVSVDINTLIKEMRNDYSLVNYSDIQIENALKQSNYNKEEALLKLLN